MLQSDTYRSLREFLFASVRFSLYGSEFTSRHRNYPETMSDTNLVCNLDYVVQRLKISYRQGEQLKSDLYLLGFATQVDAYGYHAYNFIWYPSPSFDGEIIYYLKSFFKDDEIKLRRVLVNLEFDLLD